MNSNHKIPIPKSLFRNPKQCNIVQIIKRDQSQNDRNDGANRGYPTAPLTVFTHQLFALPRTWVSRNSPSPQTAGGAIENYYRMSRKPMLDGHALTRHPTSIQILDSRPYTQTHVSMHDYVSVRVCAQCLQHNFQPWRSFTYDEYYI